MEHDTAAVLARIPLRRVPADHARGASAPPPDGLGTAGARERAVLGLLEEDLRAARAALVAVATYLADVDAALSGAGSRRGLHGLATGAGPDDQVDELSTVLWSMRRRLARVAALG